MFDLFILLLVTEYTTGMPHLRICFIRQVAQAALFTVPTGFPLRINGFIYALWTLDDEISTSNHTVQQWILVCYSQYSKPDDSLQVGRNMCFINITAYPVNKLVVFDLHVTLYLVSYRFARYLYFSIPLDKFISLLRCNFYVQKNTNYKNLVHSLYFRDVVSAHLIGHLHVVL